MVKMECRSLVLGFSTLLTGSLCSASTAGNSSSEPAPGQSGLCTSSSLSLQPEQVKFQINVLEISSSTGLDHELFNCTCLRVLDKQRQGCIQVMISALCGCNSILHNMNESKHLGGCTGSPAISCHILVPCQSCKSFLLGTDTGSSVLLNIRYMV